MSFSGFWKNVGKGFAKVGGVSIQLAGWASQHPEVIAIIEQVTKK